MTTNNGLSMQLHWVFWMMSVPTEHSPSSCNVPTRIPMIRLTAAAAASGCCCCSKHHPASGWPQHAARSCELLLIRKSNGRFSFLFRSLMDKIRRRHDNFHFLQTNKHRRINEFILCVSPSSRTQIGNWIWISQ
jgi:hypothetical protein